MKSIIIYSTKYGCTEKTANMLKSYLNGDVQLVNIMKDSVPSLEEYDNVILGGSIYIGKIQKKLINYITENLPSLMKKRVGLFICAGNPQPEERVKELVSAFPSELYNHAIVKEALGYEICFRKLNFIDKKIMAMVKGNKEDSSELSEEKVKKFAGAMSGK